MPLGEEFIFLAIPIGLLIGIICSIVGLGGGVLIIPTSIFLLGFEPKSAIVVSLFILIAYFIDDIFCTYICFITIIRRVSTLSN